MVVSRLGFRQCRRRCGLGYLHRELVASSPDRSAAIGTNAARAGNVRRTALGAHVVESAAGLEARSMAAARQNSVAGQ